MTTTVDARCHCIKCVSRTEETYQMTGHCSNCGARRITITFRKGDKASPQTCPNCGVSRGVQIDRWES